MAAVWVTKEGDRTDPGLSTGERQALEEWLDWHRATLLTKCSGLTSDQLKIRSVEPSSLSLLGLVRHMTEVERWWFRIVAAQAEVLEPVYCTEESPDADFDGLEGADPAENITSFLAEIEVSRAAVSAKMLDDIVAFPGHPDRDRNIRWIYLHMIEEYARHNGHADLLRERIDGATGD
ncbi:MAG: DinB family protein [Acidimicrobiales bacterium]